LLLERLEERTVPSFIPASYAAGAGAAAVATGDFQGLGGGNVDFATANIGNNTVSVFLNRHDGSGTFQPAVNYTVASPVDLVAGDLTGDGLPDIVVTNAGSNTVTILSNDPANPGTFQPRVGLAVGGNGPRDVRLADLNGDGFLDIVTANYSNNTVGVLLNRGDGTFAPAQTYAAGTAANSAYALAVGDFYGDGFPSVAVGNPNAGNVTILRGNGDGTLQPSRVVATPGLVTGLAAGDLGNGHVDLVSANNNTGGITVLLNDGAGNFTPQNYAAGMTPLRVKLGDVNGDGNLDVVTDNFLSTGPGNISILYGNGDGTLQAAQNVNSGGDRPSDVAVADVEGDMGVDNLNDLIVPNNVTGNVTVLIHSLAPVVVSTTLTGDFNNQTVSDGQVVFSDPIDPNTFTFDQFVLLDPNGNPVNVTGITATDGTNTRFHVTFDPQSALGTYTLTIGPNIFDATDTYMMPAPFHSTFTITNNLIVNGGFETGDFTGWTIHNGDTSFDGVSTARPHSGRFAADLGPVSGPGHLGQMFATTAGTMYHLEYWLAGDGGTPNSWQATINGTVLAGSVITNENASRPYTDFNFDFTATGATTTLQFDYLQVPAFWHLDDVSVSPAGPAPAGGGAGGAHSLAPEIVSANATTLAQKQAPAPSAGSGLGGFGVPGQQLSVAAGGQAGPSADLGGVVLGLHRNTDPATIGGVAQPDASAHHVRVADVLFGDPLLGALFQDVL
jgi:hypothetical protein